jgi:ATP-dependent protease ClpP protease subunit
MPQSVTRFSARSTQPPAGADWCRFENKTEGDKKIAEVHIYDEIGFWGTTASDFVKKLQDIEKEGPDELHVHINSPGGDVFDGVAIYSALKQHAEKRPVKVIVDALAASAASFIAQAGTETVMMRNATMMIHDASGMAWGSADTLRKQAMVLDSVSNNIADIYSQKNGTSAEDWRAVMKEEAWYTGTEAVDAGLATSVMESDNKDAEKATANWNLSVFNHAGRADAPPPSRVMQQVRFLNKEKKQMPKNHDEPAGATGDGQPVPEGDVTVPDEQVAEVQPDEEVGESGEVTPNQPVVTPPAPQTDNTAKPVVLNGVSYTVPAAVAQRLIVLEASVKESVVAGKQAFVKQLADDGKITAAQMDSLETYALGLDDKGYDSWKATWNFAQGNPLFANHGSSNTTGTSAGAPNAQQQEITDLEDIVANLKRSGLTDEQLQKTTSFKKLAALKNPTQA